jgi:hypothetical protein
VKAEEQTPGLLAKVYNTKDYLQDIISLMVLRSKN